MTELVLGLPEHWESEGRRLAESLEGISCALVVGLDPDATSRVAIGIAHGWRTRKGVAVGDLTGFAYPLYELGGGEDAAGLTDCFRDGLSLNDVARPVHSAEGMFVLPAGTPPVATEAMFRHERWDKLVRGFEKAGGLLLLIAPLGAAGLEHLEELAGGVIAVDVPHNRLRAFKLLGAADAPAPPSQPPRGRLAAGGSGGVWKRVVAIVGALALLGGASWGVMTARARRRVTPPPAAAPRDTTKADTTPVQLVVPKADTIPLNDPPGDGADSLLAAPFAVNVVAANTVAGANSVLRDGEKAILLPAVTVSPVTLGGGTIWYQVIIGAYRTRTDADDMLQLLRRKGVVRTDGGVVVRLPYGLLLADDVLAMDAQRIVSEWRAKDVMAYALLQSNGRARILAGAFETPAQAAPLAAQLRRDGIPATVAYRLGRVF